MTFRPSAAQVQFAQSLGIDLASVTSSQDLAACINHALGAGRAERFGGTRLLPEDVAAFRLPRDVVPEEEAVKAAKTFKESGLRRGDIVEHTGRLETHTCVLRFVTFQEIGVCRVDRLEGKGDRIKLFFYGGPTQPALPLELVFRAPEGFVHSDVACRERVVPQTFEEWFAYKSGFSRLAQERLTPDEVLATQYGTYWLRASVERLVLEFDAGARASLPGAASRPPCYCVLCGRTARPGSKRCSWHPGQQPAAGVPRHCQACGSKFDPPGGKESKTAFCTEHRVASSAA